MRNKFGKIFISLLGAFTVLGSGAFAAKEFKAEKVDAESNPVVYYAINDSDIPSWTHLEANFKYENDGWKIVDMVRTSNIYHGKNVYQGTLFEKHGGLDQLEFRMTANDNANYSINTDCVFSSYTTTNVFEGKIYLNGDSHHSARTPAYGTHKTYFLNFNNEYSGVKCYAWAGYSDDNNGWPGVDMALEGKTSHGHQVYSVDIYSDYNDLIFNPTGKNQSANLTYQANKAFDYKHDTWVDFELNDATTFNKHIYFSNSKDWSSVVLKGKDIYGKEYTKTLAKEGNTVGYYGMHTVMEFNLENINTDLKEVKFYQEGNEDSSSTVYSDIDETNCLYSCFGSNVTWTNPNQIKEAKDCFYQTIYYENKNSWNPSHVHVFEGHNSTNWPGFQLSNAHFNYNSHNVVCVTFLTSFKYTKAIFSNNGSNQTSEVVLDANSTEDFCYYSSNVLTSKTDCNFFSLEIFGKNNILRTSIPMVRGNDNEFTVSANLDKGESICIKGSDNVSYYACSSSSTYHKDKTISGGTLATTTNLINKQGKFTIGIKDSKIFCNEATFTGISKHFLSLDNEIRLGYKVNVFPGYLARVDLYENDEFLFSAYSEMNNTSDIALMSVMGARISPACFGDDIKAVVFACVSINDANAFKIGEEEYCVNDYLSAIDALGDGNMKSALTYLREYGNLANGDYSSVGANDNIKNAKSIADDNRIYNYTDDSYKTNFEGFNIVLGATFAMQIKYSLGTGASLSYTVNDGTEETLIANTVKSSATYTFAPNFYANFADVYHIIIKVNGTEVSRLNINAYEFIHMALKTATGYDAQMLSTVCLFADMCSKLA